MIVFDIVDYLQKKFPLANACNFDLGKIGLQFGNLSAEVKTVMVSLDGSIAVLEEAIDKKVDLLICHHPFMFNPLINLDYSSDLYKKLILVLDNNINIFAMHTNFDTADDGMNYILAKKLNLNDIYNPYKEMSNQSFLRIGFVDNISLQEMCSRVKKSFNQQNVRYVGDLSKSIHKVGIVGGAGSSEFFEAKNFKCDCLITGEIKYNIALEAKESNISLIEISHNVESFFKEEVIADLSNHFPNIKFLPSSKDIDPFNYI